MQIQVSGENAFKCQKNTFAVAPTSGGYTLQYSVNKEDWSDYETAVPAGENLIFYGCTPFMWFRLKGNTDEEITVIV